MWKLICYGPLTIAAGWLVCAAAGIPVRGKAETRFIHKWLGGNLSKKERTVPNPFTHMYAFGRSPIECRQHTIAKLKSNGDGPDFVVLNLERFGPPYAGGVLARRIRRLVDLTARHRGIPVFPVPFRTWSRVDARDGAYTFNLIQRRGRECVFTRTKTDDQKVTCYLSGWDSNEFPPLYFCTQLPRVVASIDDAREALKPLSVLTAEQQGRHIYRQGDMFAIPSAITTEDIEAQGGIIVRPTDSTANRWHRSLYGTAHTATMVATMPNGTMLAHGSLLHDPKVIDQTRDRDHRPCVLKPHRWHIVAKNTTPMAAPKPARRSRNTPSEPVWTITATDAQGISVVMPGDDLLTALAEHGWQGQSTAGRDTLK